MRQIPLLNNEESAIALPIDQNHSMVRLTHQIDWQLLEEIAKERREKVIKSTRGQQPNYRANCGAVVVRCLKSTDLRATEDLVRNYLPARYMCNLQNSHWTPDHDTIWEFEVMLGEEGLSLFNQHILSLADAQGFIDSNGLCADTTAQEAKVPYPNEVGLMGSFGRSIGRSLKTLGKAASGFSRKVSGKLKELGKQLRAHRLFSKTKEARLKVAGKMSKLSRELLQDLGDLLTQIPNSVSGVQKRAAGHLSETYMTMSQLIDQIEHWIKTGFVVKEKIVSLFQSDLRAVVRGKIGKPVEFGLKWGVNQIRGGYVHLFLMKEMRSADCEYAVAAIQEHIKLFGHPPKEYGFDRGGWSESHLEKMSTMGVKRVAVAPRGKANWRVSKSCENRIKRERAQVEGKIGTLKHYGFNKPQEKTTPGMLRAARRAELRFNCTKFIKDLFPPIANSALLSN
jgi:hypothetical protein